MIALLALTGCGSHPKKPPAPAPTVEVPAPQVNGIDQLPVDSWRRKIIEIATEEWIYFGQQKVVV